MNLAELGACDELPPQPCADPVTGRPRLLSGPCSTCIGNPDRAQPGDVRLMVAAALRDGGQGIICRETLPGGAHPDTGAALCRWFWERYGYRVRSFGVTARGGGWTVVDPPPPAGGPDGR